MASNEVMKLQLDSCGNVAAVQRLHPIEEFWCQHTAGVLRTTKLTKANASSHLLYRPVEWDACPYGKHDRRCLMLNLLWLHVKLDVDASGYVCCPSRSSG